MIGSDQGGQIQMPDGVAKSQCTIHFATPFAKPPICVANMGVDFNTYSDNIPSVAVTTHTSFVRFIIAKPGIIPDAAALTAWCRTRLAAYKVPKRFLAVADFPRTAAGKVRKPLLREMYE